MSTKTLNSGPTIALPKGVSGSQTYSIAPTPAFLPNQGSAASPSELDSFLQAENPLGCIRGVMWVMAFNVVVLLLGVMIWQTCKFLF